jgi:hypothetical protein
MPSLWWMLRWQDGDKKNDKKIFYFYRNFLSTYGFQVVFSLRLIFLSFQSFPIFACLAVDQKDFGFNQGCQIFLGPNIPKRKNIPKTTTNYTKRL